MKQKDIAVVIVIIFLSGILSFLISGKIFVTPENRQQQVEKVDEITADFQKPNPRYFNETSINPTQSSQLNDTNETPFKSTSQ